MSEMVERVARAISLSFREEGYSPEYDEPAVWDEFVRAARAAIAELREPTSTMEIAGATQQVEVVHITDNQARCLTPNDVWRAMIAAALR